MNNIQKKAVIFAPFWNQPGHVGNYRVDRFIRWLSAHGMQIVLIRAGSITQQCQTPWGVEVTIKDPLGLYRDASHDGSEVAKQTPIKRTPNRLRRLFAYAIFSPDPSVVWAHRAARHPIVLTQACGASFVLSSSPPESAHVGALSLAKNLGTRLVVDMRDGWIDEPLKPLLQASALQRWREGRLEKAVLQHADKVFVTSPVWKSLLAGRLPFTQDKITILTNGCPPDGFFDLEPQSRRNKGDLLHLVHAGRFTGSRLSQKVSYLLEPLLLGLDKGNAQGVITFLGQLEAQDIAEVEIWQERFSEKGWSIELKAAVPRDEMMAILQKTDGLLLLSASEAAIPSKLFEYLILAKPIFSATPQSSAVWMVGEALKQIFLVDYTQPKKQAGELFLSACLDDKNEYTSPSQFSDAALSDVFIKSLLDRELV